MSALPVPPRGRMTLRRRVLGYLALAALASCALTVAVGVVLVRARLQSQQLTALRNQAQVLALPGGPPGALGIGQHVYAIGPGPPRPALPRVASAVLGAVPPAGDRTGTITVGRRRLDYATEGTPTGRIVLIRPAKLRFSELRPFLISLVVAGLGGAALASLLSLALARRLTRPIGRLSDATGRVAAGEPGVQVPVDGSDELAQLGHSFNAMAADLERARESQRRFLESVSHELKTPLTSVRGYAEALEEDAVEPRDAGRIIATEAGRLERLVLDLVELARMGRIGFEVRHDHLELSAIAAAAVERHLPRAQELGVTLTSSTRGSAWGVGDEGRLLQATSNLVENALRLTPAGGEVTVTARTGEISVADTGPGLSDEDLPRAFERFYLYDRYRSERAVGSGLGLAIVQELLTAMGGSVRAANRPAGGAQFTIAVPVGRR